MPRARKVAFAKDDDPFGKDSDDESESGSDDEGSDDDSDREARGQNWSNKAREKEGAFTARGLVENFGLRFDSESKFFRTTFVSKKGMGMELICKKGHCFVASVLPGSQAEKQDVQVKDAICELHGWDCFSRSLIECNMRLAKLQKKKEFEIIVFRGTKRGKTGGQLVMGAHPMRGKSGYKHPYPKPLDADSSGAQQAFDNSDDESEEDSDDEPRQKKRSGSKGGKVSVPVQYSALVKVAEEYDDLYGSGSAEDVLRQALKTAKQEKKRDGKRSPKRSPSKKKAEANPFGDSDEKGSPNPFGEDDDEPDNPFGASADDDLDLFMGGDPFSV